MTEKVIVLVKVVQLFGKNYEDFVKRKKYIKEHSIMCYVMLMFLCKWKVKRRRQGFDLEDRLQRTI